MFWSLRRIAEMLCIGVLLQSGLTGSATLAQVEWRSSNVVAAQPLSPVQLEMKMRGLAGREAQQRVVLQLREARRAAAAPA